MKCPRCSSECYDSSRFCWCGFEVNKEPWEIRLRKLQESFNADRADLADRLERAATDNAVMIQEELAKRGSGFKIFEKDPAKCTDCKQGNPCSRHARF